MQLQFNKFLSFLSFLHQINRNPKSCWNYHYDSEWSIKTWYNYFVAVIFSSRLKSNLVYFSFLIFVKKEITYIQTTTGQQEMKTVQEPQLTFNPYNV